MKLIKDEIGWTLTFDKEGNSFISSINEWKQIFGKWNWYSFTIINIYFENDIMCPGYEFEFTILGLGFRIRVNRSWEGTKIQKSIDEIESGKAKPLSYDEVFGDDKKHRRK